ncbi:MAG: hypothetical protein AAGE89_04685 [Pseudomonadota bacterium]
MLYVLATLIPPVITVIASYFMKTATARIVLGYGGLIFLFVFLSERAISSWCNFEPFLEPSCRFMPDALTSFLVIASLIMTSVYIVAGPFLLLYAVSFELSNRNRLPTVE